MLTNHKLYLLFNQIRFLVKQNLQAAQDPQDILNNNFLLKYSILLIQEDLIIFLSHLIFIFLITQSNLILLIVIRY